MKAEEKQKIEESFHNAVEEAWGRYSLGNYREAEKITGMDRMALFRFRNGGRPTRARVIEWAEGIGENINKWLELAGYEAIPADLVREERETPKPTKERVKAYLQVADGELSKEDWEAVRAEVERIMKIYE
jgi:hypothetical protein